MMNKSGLWIHGVSGGSVFMISNEIRSPFNRQPYRQQGYPYQGQQQPRPQVNEDTLKSEKIQIERKTYNLTLKENPRGRFLRICEGNWEKFACRFRANSAANGSFQQHSTKVTGSALMSALFCAKL
jgi:hypothetical protein